jgi:hypothetical protein
MLRRRVATELALMKALSRQRATIIGAQPSQSRSDRRRSHQHVVPSRKTRNPRARDERMRSAGHDGNHHVAGLLRRQSRGHWSGDATNS